MLCSDKKLITFQKTYLVQQKLLTQENKGNVKFEDTHLRLIIKFLDRQRYYQESSFTGVL